MTWFCPIVRLAPPTPHRPRLRTGNAEIVQIAGGFDFGMVGVGVDGVVDVVLTRFEDGVGHGDGFE